MSSLKFKCTSSDHPYTKLIQTYYQGCNTADVALMKSTFNDDVVHYFVDHAPVSGANDLANYWAKIGPRTQANWTLDHIIIQEPEAVIEWSMAWRPPATSETEILRGTEWYIFENNKIQEIRSYHNNFYLQKPENRELHNYDYSGRGYRI